MFKSKYTTLVTLVASLILFIGGVVVVAAPLNIPGLVTHPGFVRGHGNGSGVNEGWGYGYGYGYFDGWGYGYGYGALTTFVSSLGESIYGFFGSDGAATIDGVTVTQTSFTVDFTTTYTTTNATLFYVNPADYLLNQMTGSTSEGADNTGSRSLTISGLTCGTVYHYVLRTTDRHSHNWNTSDASTTTSACDSTSTPEPRTTPLITWNSDITWNNSNGNNNNNNNQNNVYQFPRNLRLGMNGEDIQKLQIFLNGHSAIVSTSGYGAPGNETIHFGPATFKAVKKFQAAHANEMNLPANIVKGTGYFGPTTRTFVNYMLLNGQ